MTITMTSITRRLLAMTVVFTAALNTALAAPGSQLLTLDAIADAMSPAPRLVIMWSLDCPACFEELDLISQIVEQHPTVAISLIATDDDGERNQEIADVYQQPGLIKTSRWTYATNQGQRLRYNIDPNWQGELPRSYYVDKNGKRHGHSGLLTKAQITAVLLAPQL